MRDHIFSAPLNAVDDADQLIREIVADINRVARTVFGEGASSSIYLGRWNWIASVSARNHETLAKDSAETLVDALHRLKQKIEAKRTEADNLARTLGIEPPLSEAAE